jgi:hypothetical protein
VGFLENRRDVPHPLLEVGVQGVDLTLEMRVPFEQLLRHESQRHPVVDTGGLEQIGHLFNRLFHLSVEGEGDTVLSNVGVLERSPKEFLQAEAPAAHRRHHRDADLPRQLLGVGLDTVAHGFVHHVEGNDHRPFELQELHGQLERPPEAAGVDDVDDEIVGLLEEVALGLAGVLLRRGQGVDPRQIHDLDLPAVDQCTAEGEGDGRSGEVGRGRSIAGNRVEDRALARVGLSGEDEPHRCSASASGGRRTSGCTSPSIST